MVPYDFFSQLFCVSVEKLIDTALPDPKVNSANSSILQCLSQALLLLCARSASCRWSSVCGETIGSVCRWEVYVGTGWLHNQLLVSLWKFRPVPKPVSDTAAHTAQLTSVWLHRLQELNVIHCLHIRFAGFVSMALSYKPSHLKLSSCIITKAHIVWLWPQMFIFVSFNSIKKMRITFVPCKNNSSSIFLKEEHMLCLLWLSAPAIGRRSHSDECSELLKETQLVIQEVCISVNEINKVAKFLFKSQHFPTLKVS